MKKIISALITILILMTATTVFSAATEKNTTTYNSTYNYQIGDIEYTVEFTNDAISAEKQDAIAQKLIGIENSSVQPRGLGCTLFGHDYLYDTVYVITHKVKAYIPRCKEDTYDVTYCEDCDYTEETLVNTTYIDCCPED